MSHTPRQLVAGAALGVSLLAATGTIGSAQAEDQTDQALRIFEQVCLHTLPRHAAAKARIMAIDSDWEIEELPDLYTSYYGNGLDISVSDDHVGQSHFFCNVSVANVDLRRLATEMPGLIQSVTSETPKKAKAAFEHGAWQIRTGDGTLRFGIMSHYDSTLPRGATLTIVRSSN